VIQQIEESNKARYTMATLAQESEHYLLPTADLLGEIERLLEDLNAEHDRHLRMMADFVHPMSMRQDQ
jgi:hypothetical protein